MWKTGTGTDCGHAMSVLPAVVVDMRSCNLVVNRQKGATFDELCKSLARRGQRMHTNWADFQLAMMAMKKFPMSTKMQDVLGYLSQEGEWKESGWGPESDEDQYSTAEEDEEDGDEDHMARLARRMRTSAFLHHVGRRNLVSDLAALRTQLGL